MTLNKHTAWIVNFVADYCEPNYSVNFAVNYFGLVLGKVHDVGIVRFSPAMRMRVFCMIPGLAPWANKLRPFRARETIQIPRAGALG